MKVVTSAEMREIESRVEELGTSIDQLIELAGAAIAGTVNDWAPEGKVLVLAGPGNNGSDGLVAARILAEMGRAVKVFGFKRSAGHGYRGPLIEAEGDRELERLRALLDESDCLVDAVLGSGQSRPLEGIVLRIVETANRELSGVDLRLAVDVPTGVNADTGAVSTTAFRADVTVAMGFAKHGDVVYPGAEYAGRVEVAEVGMQRELAEEIKVSVPEGYEIAALLPRRQAAGNKGASGRVLFVGGSQDFVGAPALAAMGAYRAGAGLVEMIVPRPIQVMVAAHAPEVTYLPPEETGGSLASTAIGQIEQGLRRAQAVIYGPGMGLDEQTVELTRAAVEVLASARVPTVVDADGLNSLAKLGEWWRFGGNFVLTPHPGEMSRLTDLSIAEIQANRIETALRYAETWRQVVVLKGAGTVVAGPDGRASISPTGGPNLATAGTGDVLSGIIGGLLAQRMDPFEAAVAGTYLHGRAGDILRGEQGDVGTVASDLLAVIPAARLSILEEAETTT